MANTNGTTEKVENTGAENLTSEVTEGAENLENIDLDITIPETTETKVEDAEGEKPEEETLEVTEKEVKQKQTKEMKKDKVETKEVKQEQKFKTFTVEKTIVKKDKDGNPVVKEGKAVYERVTIERKVKI